MSSVGGEDDDWAGGSVGGWVCGVTHKRTGGNVCVELIQRFGVLSVFVKGFVREDTRIAAAGKKSEAKAEENFYLKRSVLYYRLSSCFFHLFFLFVATTNGE